jgi:hypothetical protein
MHARMQAPILALDYWLENNGTFSVSLKRFTVFPNVPTIYSDFLVMSTGSIFSTFFNFRRARRVPAEKPSKLGLNAIRRVRWIRSLHVIGFYY